MSFMDDPHGNNMYFEHFVAVCICQMKVSIPSEKYVSEKKIFRSNITGNSRGERIFEIVHGPFEGQADMYNKIQLFLPNWLGELTGVSKGQCTI